MYDYSDLHGKIVAKYGTLRAFAQALGLSEATMSKKMSQKRYFKQTEITTASKLLGIPDEEIHRYFFTLKVQSA